MSRFESSTVRIDPDLLRAEIPSYTGGNAYLYQHPVSVLVDKLHDQVLKQKQSFLLDGTSANFDIVARNIRRSVGRGRFVLIIYVYQDPALAWRFVTAREQVEGRNIPLSEFVRQYFSARDAVNRLKTNLVMRSPLMCFSKTTRAALGCIRKTFSVLTTTSLKTTIQRHC